MTTSETIGFVGIGLMGHGMAANILAAGYPLTVIAHRSRDKVDDLVARGAHEAASLADLAARSSVVFLCVPGSPQVEATVAALMEGLRAGLRRRRLLHLRPGLHRGPVGKAHRRRLPHGRRPARRHPGPGRRGRALGHGRRLARDHGAPAPGDRDLGQRPSSISAAPATATA